MAPGIDKVTFEAFVKLRSADLRRIARATRNEHELPDVVNEAWLMAGELATRKGVRDLLDTAFQDLLISHLYQHLVRYTERNVRHAVRLDHPAPGSDGDAEPNPLMGALASDDGEHPLSVLIEDEEASKRLRDSDLSCSLAGAYVRLMRRFGNRMRAVADYLLISESYAYRCCAKARLLAMCQRPASLSVMDENFMPGPWRRFRLQRKPRQLAFDFDDELPLGSPQDCAGSA